ncbi:MAG: hypothetical protein ABIE94_04955 [archaeon]
MRSKKGQMQHVFIYILTIVIVGLILLMGYRIIGNTIKQGCEVEHIQFTSDILSFADKHDTFGSYHKELIPVPCEFDQICFVDSQFVKDGRNSTSGNIIIDDSVTDKVYKNIFLVGKTTLPVGYVGKIQVSTGYICVDATADKFKVAFRGTGKATQIETY